MNPNNRSVMIAWMILKTTWPVIPPFNTEAADFSDKVIALAFTAAEAPLAIFSGLLPSKLPFNTKIAL